MNKNQIIRVSLIVFFVAALLAGGWFYYTQVLQVNYLIQGVPYNGVYNLFFQRADSKIISSVMDILGYWGDKRFNVAQLIEKFPPPDIITQKRLAPILIQDVKKFFEENGYETYYLESADSGENIRKIKEFVNPEKKVPVIVYQQRSPDESSLKGMRVVIGVFDKEKKVIVHDHDFGNNYEISYPDFQKMFTGDAGVILAAWPSEKIKGIISGPDYGISYPKRLEVMDRTGDILAIKRAWAEKYGGRSELEKSEALYKEIVNNPDFKYFPRAFQVIELSALAIVETGMNQFDEAINIIKNSALPLNYNINEPSEGWFLPENEKLFYPYIVLSRAYLKKGEKDLAISNYNEAKNIANSTGVSEEQFQIWSGQLEKEISSIK